MFQINFLHGRVVRMIISEPRRYLFTIHTGAKPGIYGLSFSMGNQFSTNYSVGSILMTISADPHENLIPIYCWINQPSSTSVRAFRFAQSRFLPILVQMCFGFSDGNFFPLMVNCWNLHGFISNARGTLSQNLILPHIYNPKICQKCDRFVQKLITNLRSPHFVNKAIKPLGKKGRMRNTDLKNFLSFSEIQQLDFLGSQISPL